MSPVGYSEDIAGLVERMFRRDQELSRRVVERILLLSREIERVFGRGHRVKIMNFCGTHEWTIVRYGLRSLLPETIELVAGPGCPVCVTPSYYIERAVELAMRGVVVYTFGDFYRLRALRPVEKAYSLSDARALGGDVRVVNSISEAVNDASRHKRESVFVAIGFETVAPGYARYVLSGRVPENMSILSLVKLTPPAMFYSLEILQEKPTEPPIAGVIAPGHVSTITGAKTWEPVAENYGIPVVVAGFEPIDVLLAVLEILRMYLRREARVVIEYERAVSRDGDLGAQSAIHKVFETRDDAWRGIGYIPKSGLGLREVFSGIDALERHDIEPLRPENWQRDLPPGCRCAEVVLGKARPTDCPLFMKRCSPERPYGPCMVSLEGACAVWARYGSIEKIEAGV